MVTLRELGEREKLVWWERCSFLVDLLDSRGRCSQRCRCPEAGWKGESGVRLLLEWKVGSHPIGLVIPQGLNRVAALGAFRHLEDVATWLDLVIGRKRRTL